LTDRYTHMSKQLAKIEAITKKLKARYVISRMHYFYIFTSHE
jgi:hypothetical protein